MERISLTIPKDLLTNLDAFVLLFAKGDLNGNRARYICSLIRKFTPKIE